MPGCEGHPNSKLHMVKIRISGKVDFEDGNPRLGKSANQLMIPDAARDDYESKNEDTKNGTAKKMLKIPTMSLVKTLQICRDFRSMLIITAASSMSAFLQANQTA